MKTTLLLVALLSTACGTDLYKGESHIYDGEPANPVLDHVAVVVQDPELLSHVQYGAAWWGETTELPFVIQDSCDNAIELCTNAVLVEASSVNGLDVGGRTTVPQIGYTSHVAISREVLNRPDMPGMLPDLVTAHEMGHALGRGHVFDDSELMNPVRDLTPCSVCIDGEHCRQWGTP